MSGGTPEDYGLESESTHAPEPTIKRQKNARPHSYFSEPTLANLIAAMRGIVGSWTPSKHDTKQAQKTRTFTQKQRDKKKTLRKISAKSRRVNRMRG